MILPDAITHRPMRRTERPNLGQLDRLQEVAALVGAVASKTRKSVG
jgi:hypothetical protein